MYVNVICGVNNNLIFLYINIFVEFILNMMEWEELYSRFFFWFIFCVKDEISVVRLVIYL